MNSSAVFAAGIASAAAALITSRFGVAGTLIGAAITTMIITGGSAVLKSYLESVTGRVRKMSVRPQGPQKPQNPAPGTIPARPDLRNNFMGRLRAAFNWFLHLSPLKRRAILVGAIVPGVIAFLISLGAVTALEVAIGKSLPCGLYNNCPVEADGSLSDSTRPSLLMGTKKPVDTVQDQRVQDFQQQAPDQQNVQPGEDPNVQPVDPQESATPEPVTPDGATPQEEAVEPSPMPAQEASPPAQESPSPSE